MMPLVDLATGNVLIRARFEQVKNVAYALSAVKQNLMDARIFSLSLWFMEKRYCKFALIA
jgi:hypothetical protein